ncbi:cytoskeletal-regulatory complex EF hand domain containing protein [Nitzschia inconspicua]|uniref:Cytoskeletal-regulatory complex EF hand domain containing protein n=1 Tax=Nitzschia inconspicua TaxID=303405 RepID=A0A9K3LNL8_9STRA|nr:cytoskeletal-regulatory complex EF hand domain containing protein [Nitzschia inconspicua]
MAASISYTPEPHEQAYYGGLFRTADVKGTGQIGGAEAVQFFARSKLPVDVLKNIWTVADQPSTSSLDPSKFAVALRLIQLTQNGQKGQGANLAVAPGVQLRPVFFEGVSGVSVPMPPPPPPTSGGPPPQQQQVPPTPSQQQRGMTSPGRGPPTPQQYQSRPPASPQLGPGGSPGSFQQQPTPTPDSRALVGQDPYVMTPQERARYEAIFPEYAKPDGYMYGQEAVALFSKSGVNQAILRDIWNMVDRPVDNRLDKLEFAMAMHLIVCISKKNLPPPQGATLPNSLLALKAATAQTGSGIPMPNPGSPAMGSIPQQVAPSSPMRPPQQIQQQQQQQHQQPPRLQQPPQVETVQETPLVGPPPIVPGGGMNISDAFEGLTLNSEQPPQYGSSAPAPIESRSLPAYVPRLPSPPNAPTSPQPGYSNPSFIPEPAEPAMRVPTSPPAPAATTPAVSIPSSSSYDLGDAHTELDKLKSVLQKLQAENISLKAQMGNMSEDEKEVRKELGAVVSEIGKLSSELSLLRQQVLDAKNRLLEASAELKAQQEHKDVLMDLISEAKQTKDVIDGATASIHNATHARAAVEAKKEEAIKRSDMFETNLFGYEESGAPSTVGQTSAKSGGDAFDNEPAGGNRSRSAAEQALSEPASNMYSNYTAPAPQVEAPPTPQPVVQTIQHVQKPTPTNVNRPPAVMGHNRQSSGFDSGFVMGGSAPPISEPSVPERGNMSSAARSHSSSGDYGFEDEEAFKIVEEMKRKAERAAEAARDAEAAASRLASEADELRSDADKAEANARSLRAKADEQKKGRFGNGKKKNMQRDADRAAEDAAEIKKRFMAVQTQAHDAATLAAQTRREADRLKNEAETAEIEMASAASLREQETPASQPAAASSNGYNMPAKSDYGTGAYGGAPAYGYGQSTDQGYYSGYNTNYGQTTAALANGGGDYSQTRSNGAPSPYDAGYGAGVVGGGGQAFELPPPSTFQSAGGAVGYSNPF